MFRRFMSPAQILQRMPDPEGGAGGQASPVTLEAVEKAVKETQTEAKKQLDALQAKYEALENNSAPKTELDALKADLEKAKKGMEDINLYLEQVQLAKGGKAQPARKVNLSEEILNICEKNWKVIVAGKGTKNAQEYGTADTEVTLFKADMSFGGNTTGPVARQEFDSTIQTLPLQIPHMRSFVPVGSTSAPVYWYTRGKLKAGSPVPGIIAPGGTKTQVEFDFTAQKVSVIKIAGYVRLPEEMLEDIDGTSSFLANYLPEEVLNKEDQQILTGLGEAQNEFNGLLTFAPVYVPTAGVDPDENWDIIADAIAQLQNKRLYPERTMVNPIDWMFLATRKTTTGEYSHPTLLYGTPLLLGGVPVVPHPEIPIDKFLTGKFTACELKIKKGLTIRFFDQDQDNAIKNMITVVAEERAAFAIYFPEAFLQGDFGRVA